MTLPLIQSPLLSSERINSSKYSIFSTKNYNNYDSSYLKNTSLMDIGNKLRR